MTRSSWPAPAPVAAVIDRDPAWRIEARELLASIGWDALLFADAAELLRAIRPGAIRALIAEGSAPFFESVRLARSVRARHGAAAPALVLCTASPPSGTVLSAFDAHLPRPCTARDLDVALARGPRVAAQQVSRVRGLFTG